MQGLDLLVQLLAASHGVANTGSAKATNGNAARNRDLRITRLHTESGSQALHIYTCYAISCRASHLCATKYVACERAIHQFPVQRDLVDGSGLPVRVTGLFCNA